MSGTTTPDALEAVLDRIVEAATTGESVEAFGIDETETRIKAYDGEVESLSSAQTRGVGVRVIADGRVGYAYTADLGDEAIAEVLAEARANASIATPDEANVLPTPLDLGDAPSLFDPSFLDVTAAQKVDIALALEVAARRGQRVKGIDSAQYGDSVATVAIASSAGVRGGYRRCEAYVLVEVLAEADGRTTSAHGLDMARLPSQLDVEGAGAEGVLRAERLLGGSKPASARMPIVLDPFATASFLGVVGEALSAEAVQKGRSLFAGRVGEAIGAAHLTLVDDGRHPHGPSSSPWDGEGVPTGRTPLLEGGVLQGFLHNTYTATKDATTSTGNASRTGFKSPPGVSPTNLYLEPGSEDQAALLRRAGDGFYCQQVLGVHSGANPVSGDFSVGAAGVMIRDGEFAEPVREATIAGTIPEMLMGAVSVGSDLRFLPFGGGMGGTTLLIEGMTLGGA